MHIYLWTGNKEPLESTNNLKHNLLELVLTGHIYSHGTFCFQAIAVCENSSCINSGNHFSHGRDNVTISNRKNVLNRTVRQVPNCGTSCLMGATAQGLWGLQKHRVEEVDGACQTQSWTSLGSQSTWALAKSLDLILDRPSIHHLSATYSLPTHEMLWVSTFHL